VEPDQLSHLLATGCTSGRNRAVAVSSGLSGGNRKVLSGRKSDAVLQHSHPIQRHHGGVSAKCGIVGRPFVHQYHHRSALRCDGSIGAVGATPRCPLTDADIQNEVDVDLAANPTWAKPGPNVEYFVYTPTDADECSGPDAMDPTKTDCFAINGKLGPNEIGAYCAYHGDHSNGTNGPYAFQPFTANGNCFTQSTFPNGVNVDTVLGATSHEEIESNTDPFLNAWIDVCGAEIGDKCAYNYGYLAPDGTNIVLNGNRYA
jgi:hypothetical protein